MANCILTNKPLKSKIRFGDKEIIAAAIDQWPIMPMTAILFRGDRWYFTSWGAIAYDDSDQAIGLATVGDQGEGTGQPTIIGIYVLRSHRRRGIGRQLLQAVVEEARRRRLLPLRYEALTPSSLALARGSGYGPAELDIHDLQIGMEFD